MTTSDEIATLFIGSWSLLSSILTTPDGRTEYPFGEDAVGCIMYTADGYMAAHLMRRERTRFVSDKRRIDTGRARGCVSRVFLLLRVLHRDTGYGDGNAPRSGMFISQLGGQ